MFLSHLELSTALRPALLPDETLLFVQDAIGLYEGKYKILDLQDGHVYLTSHRVCYVDNADPRRNSVSMDLKMVDRYEFYAGFLKSSPKISLYPKPAKRSSFNSLNPSSHLNGRGTLQIRSPSTALTPRYSSSQTLHQVQAEARRSPKPNNVTWVCTICSFSNSLPSDFDPTVATSNTSLPSCLACGIRPSLPQILKAAISGASRRHELSNPTYTEAAPQPLLESHHQFTGNFKNEYVSDVLQQPLSTNQQYQCPRCTFLNHPSLVVCELCGASLVSGGSVTARDAPERSDSPGPVLGTHQNIYGNDPESIKLSFRAGGERVFHERLKGAMVQRKWLLQSAPPIPDPVSLTSSSNSQDLKIDGHPSQSEAHRTKSAGIAGLERRGLDIRRKNEAMIGSAFEDLDALMASAKEIIALAELFAKSDDSGISANANQIIAESAKALDMVTTRDMLGSNSRSESLYLAELSRNLAEYLTDDAKGILKKEGGIMSLVDLWAIFNRTRDGVELISPLEFEKAARLWERLRLPVRLRQLRNGLLVVQQADRTDDKTIAQLLAWLQETHHVAYPTHSALDWNCPIFGRGVTAQEAAQRFGWSIGVATEELAMAEEKGALCREESVEGLHYWENWLKDHDDGTKDDELCMDLPSSTRDEIIDDVVRNLKATGLI